MQRSGDNVTTPRGRGERYSTPGRGPAAPVRVDLVAVSQLGNPVTDFGAVLLQGAVLRGLSVTEALGSSDAREPEGAGRSPRRAPTPRDPRPGGRSGSPRPAGPGGTGEPLSQRAERTLLRQKSSLGRPPPAGLGGEPEPQSTAGNRRPAGLRALRRGSSSAPGRLRAAAAGRRGRGGGRGPRPGRRQVCGPQPGQGAQAGRAARAPFPASASSSPSRKRHVDPGAFPPPAPPPLLRPLRRPPPPAPPAPHLGDRLPVAGHRLLDEAENFHVAVPARHDHPGPPEAHGHFHAAAAVAAGRPAPLADRGRRGRSARGPGGCTRGAGRGAGARLGAGAGGPIGSHARPAALASPRLAWPGPRLARLCPRGAAASGHLFGVSARSAAGPCGAGAALDRGRGGGDGGEGRGREEARRGERRGGEGGDARGGARRGREGRSGPTTLCTRGAGARGGAPRRLPLPAPSPPPTPSSGAAAPAGPPRGRPAPSPPASSPEPPFLCRRECPSSAGGPRAESRRTRRAPEGGQGAPARSPHSPTPWSARRRAAGRNEGAGRGGGGGLSSETTIYLEAPVTPR